jgi:hypothetical protein
MDDTELAAALKLDLPADLQRYASLQEPDWSAPIRQWFGALSDMSPEQVADLERFALLLRMYGMRDRAWSGEAAAEASRLMRYLDLYTACQETCAQADSVDPRTRADFIKTTFPDAKAGLDPDSPVAVGLLIMYLTKILLEQTRAAFAAAYSGAEDLTWDEAPPTARRAIIAHFSATGTMPRVE